MDKIVELRPYEVHKFPWGSAIKTSKGDWETIYLKPDAQKVEVSSLKVVLCELGVQVLGVK